MTTAAMPLIHHSRRLLRVAFLLGLLLTFPPGKAAAPVHAADQAVTWPTLRLDVLTTAPTRPVYLTHAGDGSGRLFIVEKGGRILIWRNGALLPDPFLDITDRVNSGCSECGLLSVAFPSDYATTGVFYVYYNAKENLVANDQPNEPDGSNDSVVARFHVSADPDIADPNSEEQLLLQNQPATNHNGGQLAFGPDGHLYIGLGDGGGGGDTYHNGQDTTTLLGKILRIHVTAGGPYTIPADNPFVGDPNYRDEIWAFGLRNPWRFSFDSATGDLYIGDVGQGAWEEIDVQPAASSGGENYGWPIMEGLVCYNADSCNQTGLTLPVTVYDHSNDCSVTGGFVLHSRKPGQAPVYLYSDYCSGDVRALQRNGNEWATTTLFDSGQFVTSFGMDEDGDIYLLGNGGTVARFVEQPYNLLLPALRAN